ncbi:Protein CBG27452 [Caenorhabditis briggsae]|uniref:Protein CBG27452 n=1 Tax=Caenorhabditis briggsae TaxID=6238 RepID=B6IK29_CAEBR|nr:Protein CBG27452 [Caenorhabditis briggsae]CAS00259.1 Protein CBG27452 [Caenorhabditis briggsae]
MPDLMKNSLTIVMVTALVNRFQLNSECSKGFCEKTVITVVFAHVRSFNMCSNEQD